MSTTSIEWTDKTWNPVVGCTRVSPNLRRLRDAWGWTRIEMGRRLGMPASYVCQMETGSRPIPLQTIDRVAAALELPPAQVLAELDAPSAAEAT